jgi:protein SCO1/2
MRWPRLTLPDRDLHAWLPWLLAATFIVAAEALGHRLALTAAEHTLVRAPVASTVILFLAIRRHWSHDRAAFECVTLGALAPAAWLASRALGGPAQTLPLLALGATLPGYAAWRFAPDSGQHGVLWPLRDALHRPFAPLSIALLALLFLAACTPPNPSSEKILTAPATLTTHPLRGEILRLDPARRTLLVHHEEIPGYMPAMTMEFTAPGTDFATLRPGQHLTARMLEGPPGEFRLEQVRLVAPPPAPTDTLAAAAQALRADTQTRGRKAFRELGETAPSFALYNQDGAIVRFDQFRGQRVVLNFIFTRCPIPTMCPAATAKMVALQAAVKKAGYRDVHFVSISFDAAYDTPPVLKKYAADRGIDTTNFSFLTGPETAIADLLRQFGVVTIPRENLYLHTVSTILIGADGQLLFRTEEPDWEPEDFIGRL